ncbi:MAG: thioredoxin family protein [Acidobacteriaceae bacterium]
MMSVIRWVTATLVLGASVAAFAADKPFDPTRDSNKDLHAAMQQARMEHKNILMDVGGNWCPWCILLDRTLNDDAELRALLEKNYVLLHVNFSRENENLDFLGPYPKAKGYPAWYVLSAKGKLLKAEDTSELEQTHKLDAGYNKATLKTFLMENAPR